MSVEDLYTIPVAARLRYPAPSRTVQVGEDLEAIDESEYECMLEGREKKISEFWTWAREVQDGMLERLESRSLAREETEMFDPDYEPDEIEELPTPSPTDLTLAMIQKTSREIAEREAFLRSLVVFAANYDVAPVSKSQLAKDAGVTRATIARWLGDSVVREGVKASLREHLPDSASAVGEADTIENLRARYWVEGMAAHLAAEDGRDSF